MELQLEKWGIYSFFSIYKLDYNDKFPEILDLHLAFKYMVDHEQVSPLWALFSLSVRWIYLYLMSPDEFLWGAIEITYVEIDCKLCRLRFKDSKQCTCKDIHLHMNPALTFLGFHGVGRLPLIWKRLTYVNMLISLPKHWAFKIKIPSKHIITEDFRLFF